MCLLATCMSSLEKLEDKIFFLIIIIFIEG